MREIKKLMQDKAEELLANGAVDRVLAWRSGEFFYDNAPAFFCYSGGVSGNRL